MKFEDRISDYIARVEKTLAGAMPAADIPPVVLHEAMRYSVLGDGKRIRPLLV
jgi:farnesyl diphosphate synthase